MEVITVANQKGGAGKTTLSVNLAAGLAIFGYTVLLIDLDPQCNATEYLLADRVEDFRNVSPSVYHYLKQSNKVQLKDVIKPSNESSVFVLPSSVDMKSAETEFTRIPDSNRLLLNNREDFEEMGFDYVVVDTPPVSTLINFIGLFFADRVIMPVNNSAKAISGLLASVEDLHLVRQAKKSSIKINIVVTKDMGTIASKKISKQLTAFESLRLKTTIPSGTIMERAESMNQSIFRYDSTIKQALAYLELVKEIVNDK